MSYEQPKNTINVSQVGNRDYRAVVSEGPPETIGTFIARGHTAKSCRSRATRRLQRLARDCLKLKI